MHRMAMAIWMTLLVALLLPGCAMRAARDDRAELKFPTLSGLRPGMSVDQALEALEGQHSTVIRRVDESRERDGTVYRFDSIEAQEGGAAPFDIRGVKLRFVTGELVRIEVSYAPGLTATSLEDELGPAWSNMDGTLRWYFEPTQTSVEAFPGYAGGGWHVTVEALGADEFKSIESRLEAIKRWQKLATSGPLPGRNILPPAWVRQSTPEEAVRSMARALRERDAAAYDYLTWREKPPSAEERRPVPELDRPRSRTILALAQEGARVILNGDRATLKGPEGSGVGSLELRRVRGRWFIQ